MEQPHSILARLSRLEQLVESLNHQINVLSDEISDLTCAVGLEGELGECDEDNSNNDEDSEEEEEENTPPSHWVIIRKPKPSEHESDQATEILTAWSRSLKNKKRPLWKVIKGIPKNRNDHRCTNAIIFYSAPEAIEAMEFIEGHFDYSNLEVVHVS